MIPREQWSDRMDDLDYSYDHKNPDAGFAPQTLADYNQLILHHSGRKKSPKAIETLHIDNGNIFERQYRKLPDIQSYLWNDIGYNMIIDNKTGDVYEGRDLRFKPSHVAGQNPNSIGIVIQGNFKDSEISENALNALEKLSDGLADVYGTNVPLKLSYHGQYNAEKKDELLGAQDQINKSLLDNPGFISYSTDDAQLKNSQPLPHHIRQVLTENP